jgi:ribonucleoside-diphosphate reductase alpha chain
MLRLPFTSDEAKAESRNFETLYFAACNCIYGIGKVEGPYSTFEGLQSLRENFSIICGINEELSGRWDWAALRKVMEHGVRNSLLVAPMPTASTSQILEITKHLNLIRLIFTRRVLSGEFIVVNKHLLHDLVDLGLWNETMKELMRNNGSVQD